MQRNIIGVQNEVFASENKVDLKFFISVNGILRKEKKRRYDFVLKCTEPNQSLSGKVRHLFTFNLLPREKDEQLPREGGIINEIAFASVNVKLSCEGLFEVQAYEVKDNAKENARERLKERIKSPNKTLPDAVYSFRVIFD